MNEEIDKTRSKDLVFKAYTETPICAKKLIKEAIELDPNNADAYIYMASLCERSEPEQLPTLYRKAIEAGRNALGENYFGKAEGAFEGQTEIQPYLRALFAMGNFFSITHKIDKAIEKFEEIMHFEPHDKQEIRYSISILLLSQGNLSKYENFRKKYGNEDTTEFNYDDVLYMYKKFGKIPITEKTLVKAYKSNPFVIEYMLNNKKMPLNLPETIQKGGRGEAICYVNFAWPIWHNTPGVLTWLEEEKQKLSIR